MYMYIHRLGSYFDVYCSIWVKLGDDFYEDSLCLPYCDSYRRYMDDKEKMTGC